LRTEETFYFEYDLEPWCGQTLADLDKGRSLILENFFWWCGGDKQKKVRANYQEEEEEEGEEKPQDEPEDQEEPEKGNGDLPYVQRLFICKEWY